MGHTALKHFNRRPHRHAPTEQIAFCCWSYWRGCASSFVTWTRLPPATHLPRMICMRRYKEANCRSQSCTRGRAYTHCKASANRNSLHQEMAEGVGSSCPGPAGADMFPPGSQQVRMLSGRPYHQGRDAVLVVQRVRCRQLVRELEALPIDAVEQRKDCMLKLFGSIVEDSPPWIEHGFRTDFGCNTTFGRDVYINYDAIILDCGPVAIGNRVLFAPRVQLLGATHPLHFELRNGTQGAEFGQAITIGDDVWLGAGCIVLGGVTIGRGSVVGAGAVVTRDVEPLSVVAGNPARLLRRLPEHTTPEEKAAHTVLE